MKVCSECDVRLNENNDCPKCNKHYVFIEEKVALYDEFDLKGKDPRYKSKKHSYAVTAFEHLEQNYDCNQLVRRFKKEDRIADEYEEIIQTLDGKVLLNKKEALSDHVNHGNAKRKRKEE